jgi:hypothetical protein
MALSILQRQDGNFVDLVVVVGEANRAIENFEDMGGFVFDGKGVWAVAFEAQVIPFGAQKFIAVTAMGIVAGPAALREGGLVMHGFLAEIRDIRVATETNVHGIRFRQTDVFAGVGIVAIGAIARRAGMLDLGGFNRLSFFVVAGYADGLGISLRQDHFTVFGWGVAEFALFVGERWMRVLGH